MLAYLSFNALQAALTLQYPLVMYHFVKKLLATEKHGAITRYLTTLAFSSGSVMSHKCRPTPCLVLMMMRVEQGTVKI
jgi:hypothetical protein